MVPHTEGDPCPVKRSFHAAVCVCYAGHKPQLIVTGGIDVDDDVLTDVWIMDIQSGRWKKVSIYGTDFYHVIT